MDTPRTKRPDFIPYTTEVAINEACDSLIAIINVRRAKLLELLKERRKKIENLKKCKERAQLEFPQEESFFTAAVASRWYWTPRIPAEKQSQLYTHLYWKEREAYGSWKTSVVCDKKTFRESLKNIIDVVLEVTNPEDMKYQSATYEHGVLTVGKEGNNEGQYKNPGTIALDESTQEIFIADSGNSRIVVCSSTGKYMHQFGEGILNQPHGLALAPDCLYTTDVGSDTLFKFSRPEYQLMGRIGKFGCKKGQFNYPRQLAINPSNGYLYVCDTDNNRVSVYSPALQYQYSITDKAINENYPNINPNIKLKNYELFKLCDSSLYCEAMKYPRDIKFNNNEMFVLCSSLSVFNSKYKLVRTLLRDHLDNAFFFCIDRYSNILVSYYSTHNICIYSPTGDLLNTGSKRGHDVGEFNYPTGICVTNTGRIICVSSNRNHTVQIFY